MHFRLIRNPFLEACMFFHSYGRSNITQHAGCMEIVTTGMHHAVVFRGVGQARFSRKGRAKISHHRPAQPRRRSQSRRLPRYQVLFPGDGSRFPGGFPSAARSFRIPAGPVPDVRCSHLYSSISSFLSISQSTPSSVLMNDLGFPGTVPTGDQASVASYFSFPAISSPAK